MILDPKALDPHAIDEMRRIYALLPDLEPGQSITHIYLHWAVEPYGDNDNAYNATISLGADGQWRAVIDTDPRLNATEPPQSGYAAHTYHRNGHAVGIAVSAMLGASPGNFGPYPIQQHQIEVMCAVAAAFGFKYGIDVSDPLLDMSHAEAAAFDGYFGERWDLERLAASDDPLSKLRAVQTGNMLREQQHAYKMLFDQPGFQAGPSAVPGEHL